MLRVASLAALLFAAATAPAAAQRADSAAPPLPLGTVVRVTLETTGGPLVAIGTVSSLRDAEDCLHLSLTEDSETARFGIRVTERLPVDRQLGTPRPDGTRPTDVRWVPVPVRILAAAGIGCIQGD